MIVDNMGSVQKYIVKWFMADEYGKPIVCYPCYSKKSDALEYLSKNQEYHKKWGIPIERVVKVKLKRYSL